MIASFLRLQRILWTFIVGGWLAIGGGCASAIYPKYDAGPERLHTDCPLPKDGPVKVEVTDRSGPLETSGPGIIVLVKAVLDAPAGEQVRRAVEAGLKVRGYNIDSGALNTLHIDLSRLSVHLAMGSVSPMCADATIHMVVSYKTSSGTLAVTEIIEREHQDLSSLELPSAFEPVLSKVLTRAIDRALENVPEPQPVGKAAPDAEEEKAKEHSGSGFFVSSNGYVATAAHVVGDRTKITVRTADGSEYPAEIVAISFNNDVALLRVAAQSSNHLVLGDSTSVRLGQAVFTIGHPLQQLLGPGPVYTNGTVSALTGLRGEASVMQISVPVQPGSSGGPLVNEKGEVVGLVTSTAAIAAFLKYTGTLPQNISWAVRAEALGQLVPRDAVIDRGQIGEAVEHTKASVVLIKAE